MQEKVELRQYLWGSQKILSSVKDEAGQNIAYHLILSFRQQELKGNQAGEEENKIEWFAKTPESEKEVGRYSDG